MTYIRLNKRDNVAVIAKMPGVAKGENLTPEMKTSQYLTFGTKVSLKDLKNGDSIVKYGVVIGFAKTDIKAGSLINEANLIEPKVMGLDSLKEDVKNKPKIQHKFEPEEFCAADLFFMGYINSDGSVGTRNYLAISSTVHCVSGVVKHAVDVIKNDLLPLYKNVDGVVFLDHTYGCGVAIDAKNADIPINTIGNLTNNPNFGGQIMFVGLGCEKLRRSKLEIGDHSFISLQGIKRLGFQAMVSDIVDRAKMHLESLNVRRRQKCPLSALTIGVQCGGSDSISGITANPLVGHVSDCIVSEGGSMIFSEITEVRDSVSELFNRCETSEVAEKLLSEFEWYDNYLGLFEADHFANTTPGNKAGGITNIVEKAMGSVTKSGQSQIVDVLRPGDRVKKRGLNFLAGPASDFICGTLQFAAGANLHIFTTGRGTPYSIDGLPTIKVSSNSDLGRKWSDIIDFDAGILLEDEAGMLKCRDDFIKKILEIASGKKTCAEELGISNSIVLFNPSAIT